MELDFELFRERMEAALGHRKLYGGWLEARGVNKSTLNSAMTRRAIPGIEILTKIADECGVSVDFLLGRDSQPPTPAINVKNVDEAIATLKALTAAVDHQPKLTEAEEELLESFRRATPERRDIVLGILTRKVG